MAANNKQLNVNTSAYKAVEHQLMLACCEIFIDVLASINPDNLEALVDVAVENITRIQIEREKDADFIKGCMSYAKESILAWVRSAIDKQ